MSLQLHLCTGTMVGVINCLLVGGRRHKTADVGTGCLWVVSEFLSPADGMAQWVEALAAKPKDPSLIVDGTSQLL